LHREAPVHVDGFQGSRWSPKVRNNHTYTVSDELPTAYYPQPVPVLLKLDESKHNFFWYVLALIWSPYVCMYVCMYVCIDNVLLSLMTGK
jgi:hypothetical protein